MTFARTNERTTPVSQATSSPDSELTRLRQVDEGRVPPTAGGRRREPSLTASRHYLRNTRTRTCRRERAAGPGVRLATSPTTGTATETRSGRRNNRTRPESTTIDPREKDSDPVLTVQVGTKTGCPLCTASFTLANSMRTHLRRHHCDYRMVRASKQAPETRTPEVSRTGNTEVQQGVSTQRPRRGMVTNRLLSAQQTTRLGTWNVRSLRGLGKAQQLAMEMERHKVSVLAVTETHLPGSGEMALDESKRYRMVFSGRQDGNAREGVGLAFAPHTKAALRCYEAVSSIES